MVQTKRLSFGMILGAANLILLALLVGVASFVAKKREAARRHRYLFGAALILLGGALALTTWLGS
jgi:hypothetical protein